MLAFSGIIPIFVGEQMKSCCLSKLVAAMFLFAFQSLSARAETDLYFDTGTPSVLNWDGNVWLNQATSTYTSLPQFFNSSNPINAYVAYGGSTFAGSMSLSTSRDVSTRNPLFSLASSRLTEDGITIIHGGYGPNVIDLYGSGTGIGTVLIKSTTTKQTIGYPDNTISSKYAQLGLCYNGNKYLTVNSGTLGLGGPIAERGEVSPGVLNRAGFIKNGAGTVLLADPGTSTRGVIQSYSSGFSMLAGIAGICSSSNFGVLTPYGPFGSGKVFLQAGVIQPFYADQTVANEGSFSVLGSGSIVFSTGRDVNGQVPTTPYDLTWSGSITLGGGTQTLTVSTKNMLLSLTKNVSNATSGASNLTKDGLGMIYLSGSNTYQGQLTVSKGFVQAGSNGALGTSGGITWIDTDGRVELTRAYHNSGETLRFSGDGDGDATFGNGEGAVVAYSNNTLATSGDLILYGNAAAAIRTGSTFTAAGAVKSSSTSVTRTFWVQGGGTLNFHSSTLSRINWSIHGGTTIYDLDTGSSTTGFGAEQPLASPLPEISFGALTVPEESTDGFREPTYVNGRQGNFAFSVKLQDRGIVGVLDIQSNSSGVESTITGDGTLRKRGPGMLTCESIRSGGLLVDQGVLKLRTGGGTAGTSVLRDVYIGSGKQAQVALDLADHDLVIDYDGASPIGSVSDRDSIAGMIASAWRDGQWNGSGITTSSAGSSACALAYAEASEVLSFVNRQAIFSGISIDDTAVLVKFTRIGDANLDGVVDASDLDRLTPNLIGGNDWLSGDFDYDGQVGVSDLRLLSLNWCSSRENLVMALQDHPNLLSYAQTDSTISGLLAGRISFNVVPEPSGACGGTFVALLFARRRPRLEFSTAN
jgi:autotransporter-associated beta strand protein